MIDMTFLKELENLPRRHKGTIKQMLDILHIEIEEPVLHL